MRLNKFVPAFYIEKDPSREAANSISEVSEKSCVSVTVKRPQGPALEKCAGYQLGHTEYH